MVIELSAFIRFHPLGESATHPIARLAGCLAVLLLLAGAAPASSSRLARQPASRTLGRVQLSFLGSIAKVYGNRILLSPRGPDWHFLAHEWSHAEIRQRMSFGAWLRLPQWFDEGLAVAISEAPEHSEAHWQWLLAKHIPHPSPQDLRSYQSLHQWLAAVGRYGEKDNVARKAQGLPEIRPVYAAAGHEVRPWLAAAGTPGLLKLIQRLNEGEEFAPVYQTVVH
jgi:hypothetical protein